MGDCIFFHYNFRRRVSIKLENPDWRSLEKVEAHIITTPRSGCSGCTICEKKGSSYSAIPKSVSWLLVSLV